MSDVIAGLGDVHSDILKKPQTKYSSSCHCGMG